jgi:hypothetical protein
MKAVICDSVAGRDPEQGDKPDYGGQRQDSSGEEYEHIGKESRSFGWNSKRSLGYSVFLRSALRNGGPVTPRNVPINTISWLCTHNAFNSAAEISGGSHEAGGTNQNYSIVKQLEAGVRALMIDVHEDQGGPRVRHEGGILDRDLHYEDLCDLLTDLKNWLGQNRDEILLLLLEVTNDVKPEWIRDTFAGAGPVSNGRDYDLRAMLYEHTSGEWPSIQGLVALDKRIIVFRETDGDKGRVTDDAGNAVPSVMIGGQPASLGFYQDMWEHWLETPYSNTWTLTWSGKEYWESLQKNAYILSPNDRGNRARAAFFNLNHFVDSSTYAAGSAGAAEGINQPAYLAARALIAWKMQGCRPTLSVDFFKSVDGQPNSYNTLDTSTYLNEIPAISGTFKKGNVLFEDEISWAGVSQLGFSEHLGQKYMDWTIDDSAVQVGAPRSRRGVYSFPQNTDGTPMTLIPMCPGYDFDPPSVTWDGLASVSQHFTVTPGKYASRDAIANAGILDTPIWIHPFLSESPVTYWEVESDSANEDAPLELWPRTENQNKWKIRHADTFNGRDRFTLYNTSLSRYASVMYPWDARARPSIEGYPVTSNSLSQYVNTQRFFVALLPDGSCVFVSSDVGDYAIASAKGNLGRSTKLVLGALSGQFPDWARWKIKKA